MIAAFLIACGHRPPPSEVAVLGMRIVRALHLPQAVEALDNALTGARRKRQPPKAIDGPTGPKAGY